MFTDLTVGNVVTVIVCLLIAMTVHEFMHAYVGLKLGDTTAMERGRVSFNPLHHIDPVMTILLPAVTLLLFHAPILAAKPVPYDRRDVRHGDYGVALIAAAGPLSNLALAFLGSLVLRCFGLDAWFAQALAFFIELNVALLIFNLIPIPPLDGSRVLYAFAPEAVQDFMKQIEPYGLFIIIGLVLWGGAGGILANLNNFVLNLLP
ncbi:MAG TPA: site-2 protease family protein [Candidatus Saccharimonadales bacterium]|nr:site-2 protease family protein [Candidatus Saccharimonadales bacterium]